MNNLQKRLLEFSKSVIVFAKSIPFDSMNKPLITQLIRSATSIGANYTEAQSGYTKKDFRAKVSIAKKEAAETLYWLELLDATLPERGQVPSLKSEANEICKILQSILNNSKP